MKQASLSAVILAAGKGTRMRSPLPKVLHPILGKPIIEHVIASVQRAHVQDICLVLGKDHAEFSAILAQHPNMAVCVQSNQAGTGDAVASTAAYFKNVKTPVYTTSELKKGKPTSAATVLVCLGDTPALSSSILQDLLDKFANEQADIGVLGFEPPSPKGYGRLILDKEKKLVDIVEDKDTDSETQNIRLCNSGVIVAKVDVLFKLLERLQPNNSQKEYYLTDCVKLACELKYRTCIEVGRPWQSFSGINTPEQLSELEQWMREAAKP